MSFEGYRTTVSPRGLLAAFVFAAAVLLVALLSRPVENLLPRHPLKHGLAVRKSG